MRSGTRRLCGLDHRGLQRRHDTPAGIFGAARKTRWRRALHAEFTVTQPGNRSADDGAKVAFRREPGSRAIHEPAEVFREVLSLGEVCADPGKVRIGLGQVFGGRPDGSVVT